MSTFSVGGPVVSFTAIEEAWTEPATSAVGIRAHPNTNTISVSLGGMREVTRTVTCVFADRGEYVTFALMRGQQGTLTVDNWDSVDAVLKESNADPPFGDGSIRARANFVLL